MDRQEAIYRYRMHYWCTVGLTAVLSILTVFLLKPESHLSDWPLAFAIGGIAAASGFVADWVCAVAFKRKSRPWHWHRHPDDEDPRK